MSLGYIQQSVTVGIEVSNDFPFPSVQLTIPPGCNRVFGSFQFISNGASVQANYYGALVGVFTNNPPPNISNTALVNSAKLVLGLGTFDLPFLGESVSNTVTLMGLYNGDDGALIGQITFARVIPGILPYGDNTPSQVHTQFDGTPFSLGGASTEFQLPNTEV